MMWMACTTSEFQSTLSVRRATQRRVISVITVDISIHALRKESDVKTHARPGGLLNFNPRSP